MTEVSNQELIELVETLLAKTQALILKTKRRTHARKGKQPLTLSQLGIGDLYEELQHDLHLLPYQWFGVDRLTHHWSLKFIPEPRSCEFVRIGKEHPEYSYPLNSELFSVLEVVALSGHEFENRKMSADTLITWAQKLQKGLRLLLTTLRSRSANNAASPEIICDPDFKHFRIGSRRCRASDAQSILIRMLQDAGVEGITWEDLESANPNWRYGKVSKVLRGNALAPYLKKLIQFDRSNGVYSLKHPLIISREKNSKITT